MFSVPRRIGRHRTAYLVLSGKTLDAATALEWGLIDEITQTSISLGAKRSPDPS